MTHRDGFPHASRLGFSARSVWRGDAPASQTMRVAVRPPQPKALAHKTWGSRRSGRAGEPALGVLEGVGRP